MIEYFLCVIKMGNTQEGTQPEKEGSNESTSNNSSNQRSPESTGFGNFESGFGLNVLNSGLSSYGMMSQMNPSFRSEQSECSFCHKDLKDVNNLSSGDVDYTFNVYNQISFRDCPNCHSVYYCSEKCQQKHFQVHLRECKGLKDDFQKYEIVKKMNFSEIAPTGEDPEDFFVEGMKYLDKKDYSMADFWFRKALEKKDDYFEAHFNLGIAQSFLYPQNQSYALDSFSKAIELSPNRSEAYFHRGISLFRSGRYSFAVDDFDKAIEIRGSYYDAHLYCGLTHKESGKKYDDQSDNEKAIKDFTTACISNPEGCFAALSHRGLLLKEMGDLKQSKKDLLHSIEINHYHQNSNLLCNLGNVFSQLGEFRRCEEHFKKAVDLFPDDVNVFRSRFESVQVYDVERALDDYAKVLEFSNPEDTENEWDQNQNLQTLINRLENSISEKNLWFPFLKDEKKDEVQEKDHLLQLKREISGKKFRDVKIFRCIGRGSFGATYLCQIQGIGGIFVLKLLFPVLEHTEEKHIETLKTEMLELPYHRNVVSILTTFTPFTLETVVNTETLPDYEENWKDRFPTMMNCGIIVMKNYRKDLQSYLFQRKKDEKPFKSPHEIIYILHGIFEGVSHLHDHMIVHRDLHLANVFVDESYGRSYVGDFGCALDLRGRSEEVGFKVKKSELVDVMFSGGSGGDTNVGGCKRFLPPEILDYIENKEETYLDYEKCDLFSIGIIGYILVCFDVKCTPFGLDDEKAEKVYDRKEEEFIPLDSERYKHHHDVMDRRLVSLIHGLLKLKMEERFSFVKATKKFGEILSSL